MRAEIIVLRAKRRAARRSREMMVERLVRGNVLLKQENLQLKEKLQRHEDEDKLIRPATMHESTTILTMDNGSSLVSR